MAAPRPDRLVSLGRVGLELAGWGYLAMVVLVCLDVIGRRMFGISTGSTTELGGYLLAFGISWGLAGTLLDRSHIRIDVLIQRLAPARRLVFHVAALLILCGVSALFLYAAYMVAADSLDLGATDLTPLRMPLALPQGLWAVGFAWFAVCAVLVTARVVAAALTGRVADAEAACQPKTYEDEAEETLQALAEAPGHADPDPKEPLR